METPTKDARRSAGAAVLHSLQHRGILQQQSPNHQLHQQHSFGKYRDVGGSDGGGASLYTVDSGYSSCLDSSSILTTSAGASSLENSPVHNHHLHRQSLANSCHNTSSLTPILEGIEMPSRCGSARAKQHQSMPSADLSSHIDMLTPSSRTAAELSAIHISGTPEPPKSMSASFKRLLNHTPSKWSDATAAKSRRLDTSAAATRAGHVTPSKGDQQRSPFARTSPMRFMKRLLTAELRAEPASENAENHVPAAAPPSTSTQSSVTFDAMDFSPIPAGLALQQQTRMRKPGGAGGALQRIASDHRMQSSTPNWARRGGSSSSSAKKQPPTAAIPMQASRFRRWQSFSPSKAAAIARQQQQQSLPKQALTGTDHTPPAFHPLQRSEPMQVLADTFSPRKSPTLRRSPAEALAIDAASATANPARKLLDFAAGSFDELVRPTKKSFQRQPTMRCGDESSPASTTTGACRSNFSINSAQDVQLNTSIVVDGRLRTPSPPSSSSSSDRGTGFLAARRLLVAPTAAAATNASIPTDCDLLLNSAIVCSPMPATASTSDAGDTPSLSESLFRSMRTPKKMQRSFSLQHHQPESVCGSALREQQRILYANLPCTPPKSVSRRGQQHHQLKRLCDTQLVRRSPAKRKLYNDDNAENIEQRAVGEPQQPAVQPIQPVQSLSSTPAKTLAPQQPARRRVRPRRCLAGTERLDILGRLQQIVPAIDRILGALGTDDLGRVRQVSTRWRALIEANPAAAGRVQRMERRFEVSKENGGASPVSVATEAADAAGAVITAAQTLRIKRKPFNRLNSLSGGTHSMDAVNATQAPDALAAHSPPVSPTTRAFRDNQALVKTLKTTQRLMKCPRCSRSSVIDRCPPSTALHKTLPIAQAAADAASNRTLFGAQRSRSAQSSSSAVHSLTPPFARPARPSMAHSWLLEAQSSTFDEPDPYGGFRSTSSMSSGSSASSASTSSFGSTSSSMLASACFDSVATMCTTLSLGTSSSDSSSRSSSASSPSPTTLPTLSKHHHNGSQLKRALAGLEFGQCSNRQCAFRFCVQCLCDFDAQHERTQRCTMTGAVRAHVGGVHVSGTVRVATLQKVQKAPKLSSGRSSTAASSSSVSVVAGSKKSKSNLRRLSSLDV